MGWFDFGDPVAENRAQISWRIDPNGHAATPRTR